MRSSVYYQLVEDKVYLLFTVPALLHSSAALNFGRGENDIDDSKLRSTSSTSHTSSYLSLVSRYSKCIALKGVPEFDTPDWMLSEKGQDLNSDNPDCTSQQSFTGLILLSITPRSIIFIPFSYTGSRRHHNERRQAWVCCQGLMVLVGSLQFSDTGDATPGKSWVECSLLKQIHFLLAWCS